MAVEVLLPKVGLTMTEGTVTEVHASDGTAIEIGDALVTVSTDKVDVDIEAESAGVFYVGVERGATLAPGEVVGWVVEPGETPPTAGAAAADAVPEAAATPPNAPVVAPTSAEPSPDVRDGRLRASPNAKRVAAELGLDLASVRGTGPEGRIVSEDVEEAVAAGAPGTTATSDLDASRGADTVGASRLHPPLRRLARSLGVDPSSVVPTGLGGTVLRSDVVAAGQAAAAPSGAPTLDGNAVTRVVPLTGMRGTIARRMHASLQQSAQLTHGYHVALDAVLALRDQIKSESAAGEIVPSINDFVVKAAALGLREHPGLNATIVDDEIRELADVHVGLAVAVPDGLYVPVVRHADELTLREVAEETRTLAAAAREGRLTVDQLEGGSFAVTSLGTYGVDFFTPVINPGNVAILGVGQAREGVRWEGDRPVRTQEVTLSLTFDHRAVDGAPAAEYLRTLERLLTRPLRLLLD